MAYKHCLSHTLNYDVPLSTSLKFIYSLKVKMLIYAVIPANVINPLFFKRAGISLITDS